MIGRAREMTTSQRALAEAKSKRAPIVVRVTGEPGVGKTHFLRELSGWLAEQGWFTVDVSCHGTQRHTPFLVSNRVVASAIAKLGPESKPYTSGLEDGLTRLGPNVANLLEGTHGTPFLDSESYKLVFRRFFEGLAADHDVAILCDDAQWIDAASAAMLTLLVEHHAPHSISIVISQRPSSASEDSRLTATLELPLAELDFAESLELARRHLEDASGNLVEAVAHHAAGNPLEIVVLAEELRLTGSEQVERSLRRRIARHLASLDGGLREFIQTCALLGEPIEYRLLGCLYADERHLLDLLAKACERYLVADGSDYRFRHALFADAVSQTVAVAIPLRKRIINALRNLPDADLSDYERIADHARACGDRPLESDTYVKLAEEAFARQAWSVVVRASERAIALRSATDLGAGFLQRYARALRAFDREPEAGEMLLKAIPSPEAIDAVEGVGELVALLVSISLELEHPGEALDLYRRYLPALKAPGERASLIASAMYVAAGRVDENLFRELEDAFTVVETQAGVRALASRHATRAAILCSRGDPERASQEMKAALARTDMTNPRHRDLQEFGAMIYEFRERGCGALTKKLPELNRRMRFESHANFYGKLYEGWAAFFAGDWPRALAIAHDAYRPTMPVTRAAAVLAIPAAVSALRGMPPSLESAIAETAVVAVREGYRESVLQFVPWWLMRNRDAAMEQFVRKSAATLANDVPRFTAIGYLPFSISVWAVSRNERSVLEALSAAESSRDRAPWAQANWDAARGIALSKLGDASGVPLLLSSSKRLHSLGAPFLAAYIAHAGRAASAADQELLSRLGVIKRIGTARRRIHDGPSSDLTVRERDVARVVGNGLNNRQAAETLFISERTVEVHLGNIFAKLGLSSRTQLVRWVLERQIAS